MKRVILFAFSTFLLLSQIHSQTISFEILKTPCVNDGILKANFVVNDTATLIWYYNGKSVTEQGYFSTSDTIFDWGGGPVSLVIKNANGGTIYGGYKSDLPFQVNVTQTLDTCPKPSFLEVNTTGGTPPFSYEWYKVEGGNNNFIGNSNPVSVSTGIYTVVVKDANGCISGTNVPGSQPNMFYVNTPVSFSYDIVSTDANCANGTLSVENIVGGKQPFSFQWSNGANSQFLNNLKSGNFQLTITDADGCVDVEYEAYVSQAYDIPVNITNTPSTCSNSDGSAIAFVSGGTLPYSYNWSNGSTTQQISNLTGGNYQLVVTDAGGCTGTSNTFVASISPVQVLVQSVNASACTAPTGSATISISGGTPPYNVSWSTFPQQSGVKLENVPAGQYSYKVVDITGCVRTGTVIIQPESVIAADFAVVPAECATSTGSVKLTVAGGTAPYNFTWNTGSTANEITNLPSGVYVVTITDSKACKITKAISVGKSSPMNAGVTTSPASCIFTGDGSAGVSVYNGLPPYDYTWSNGAKTATIDSLTTGKYSVFVQDAQGCQFFKELTVGYDADGDDCYCILEGTVYHDLNEDCIKDKNEPGIKNIQLYCSGVGYTYTDSIGHYSFKVPSGDYNLSQYGNVYYPLAPCQSNTFQVKAVAGNACRMTFDFGNKVNSIHDVRIGLWNDNIPVPGFKYTQHLIVSNDGTLPESQVIASYKNDNQLGVPVMTPNLLNVQTTPGYFTNAGLLQLKPGESQKIRIDYTVPTNMPVNTDLFFTDSTSTESPMSTWLNDFTPWNNVNQRHATVLSSYDPNFIEVSPQGFTDKGYITQQDSVLEYMVHFQNLGNYFATNVKVDVVLDSDLEFVSVSPVYSSFPASILLHEDGILSYYFENIQLFPESWNEEFSKGFFTFSVKQKPGLTKGTEIKNFADIYFDYNSAVRTNNSLNTIDYRVDVSEPDRQDLVNAIYPNPARNTLNIKLNSRQNSVNVNILDLYGRIVSHQQFALETDQLKINTDKLSSGMYFVEIFTGSSARSVQKVVINKE